MKYSILQKSVLNLYRNYLKTINKNTDNILKEKLFKFVKEEFKKNIKIQKNNINLIEYKLRKGKIQLNEILLNNIKDINNF